MRILHTSDWHLGIPDRTGEVMEDQKFFLEQLYNIINGEKIDAVIVAGDVYDSAGVGADAVGVWNEAATKICLGLHAKMLVISGNHDSGARLAVCRELLSASGLYISGRLEKDILPVRFTDADVWLVPFFSRDEIPALWQDEKPKSDEEAMRVVTRKILEKADRDRFNIIVSHAFVVGSELSESDRAAQVGLAQAIPADTYDGFDYAALGHIHKPQSMTGNVVYSGSPVKYSFGNEEKQTKSVVILDTSTGEKKLVPLKQLHERLTISGTYDEVMSRDDLSDKYLRLTVTDRYAGLELLSGARERFPFLRELYGMSVQPGGEMSAISPEELDKLDETDILLRFMEEQYGEKPDEEQISLFREVMKSEEKE